MTDDGRRVLVPIGFDVFGRPTGFIECDREAVGQYDESRWSDRPPSS